MAEREHQQPKAEDTTAAPSADGASPGAFRFFVTIGILLWAAWHAYDGFKHPEVRSAHLLRAVGVLLFGALFWVHRLNPMRGAQWAAACFPLLVVVAFGWAQLGEARHQETQKKLAFKNQAWQQAVHRQTELSHLASERWKAAMVKHSEAFRVWIETRQELKLADGKPGFGPTPDATRKLEEAKDELDRAFERDQAERERLLRLEAERPYR